MWKDPVMAEIDWSQSKVYVAGHRGLVGSALVRALEAAGVGEVVGWPSKIGRAHV